MDKTGIKILQDSAMENPFQKKRLDPFSDVVRPGVLTPDFPQAKPPLRSVGENSEREYDEKDVESFNHSSTSFLERALLRGN